MLQHLLSTPSVSTRPMNLNPNLQTHKTIVPATGLNNGQQQLKESSQASAAADTKQIINLTVISERAVGSANAGGAIVQKLANIANIVGEISTRRKKLSSDVLKKFKLHLMDNLMFSRLRAIMADIEKELT